MDWNAAIERNREALRRVLAMLVAMAGLGSGEATLPRHLHRAVLGLLRPAEAAARRLIIVAARGLVVALPPPRLRKPKPTSTILRNGVGTGILMPRQLLRQTGLSRPAPRSLALPLFDPLPGWGGRQRPVARSVPRISVPGCSAPFPVALRRLPSPDDPVNAARLALRLEALDRALDDLPGQARRFARWRAARGAGRVRRRWPLRPGRPPGWRRKPVHDVHEVLNVLHGLAFWALESPDTS